MITLRQAQARGHFNHGWLDTWHSFSFADYHDPANMGFRDLRVINDDRIAAGMGFGTHGHRDMEIVTYVLEGELAHRDSTGGGSVLRPGDVQRMSAGTGVRHSEFNGSKEKPVHLLQIWILPAEQGIDPSYEEKHFDEAARANRLALVASPDAREGSLIIHQDVAVYASILDPGKKLEANLAPDRHGWLQVARGSLTLNGKALGEGDGASISEEPQLRIEGTGAGPAEFLFFDLN
jgi:quercetin 2,3-dioxygenase